MIRVYHETANRYIKSDPGISEQFDRPGRNNQNHENYSHGSDILPESKRNSLSINASERRFRQMHTVTALPISTMNNERQKQYNRLIFKIKITQINS